MKITIVLDDGSRHKAKLPYDGATHLVLDLDCPHGCKRRYVANPNSMEQEPLKVAGSGIKHHNRDTYFADAIALCCKKKIGTIETKVSTVFGIEEDEAVLNGPWRVY